METGEHRPRWAVAVEQLLHQEKKLKIREKERASAAGNWDTYGETVQEVAERDPLGPQRGRERHTWSMRMV